MTRPHRIRRPVRFRPTLVTLERRDVPAVFTVTNLTDADPGSLRDQIAQAQAGDIVQFDPGLAGGTITLTSDELLIRKSISIDGGANQITVSGNNAFRVFEVAAAATVTISGLTVTGGLVSTGNGGGISNAGALTINGCTIIGNTVSSYLGTGGGVANTGTLRVVDSALIGNIAGISGGIDDRGRGTAMVTTSTVGYNAALGFGDGGGIGVFDTGSSVTVTDSTIIGNFGAGYGGGITADIAPALTVTRCLFTGNYATISGGGISKPGGAGAVRVTASTFAGNAAAFDGGGIYNLGNALTLIASTITGNSASRSGGGISTAAPGPRGASAIQNTIVAGNTGPGGAPSDIFGPFNGGSSFNLIGIGGSGTLVNGVFGNIVGVADPKLGPLGDYGGPTQTVPLLTGSPALNVGDPAQAGSPDQRGVVRGGGTNIGAYQATATQLVVSAPSTVSASAAFDVAVTAEDVFGQVAAGYTGTVTLTSTDPLAPSLGSHLYGSADGGIFIFASVQQFTLGLQILTADDGTLTGSIDVTVT